MHEARRGSGQNQPRRASGHDIPPSERHHGGAEKQQRRLHDVVTAEKHPKRRQRGQERREGDRPAAQTIAHHGQQQHQQETVDQRRPAKELFRQLGVIFHPGQPAEHAGAVDQHGPVAILRIVVVGLPRQHGLEVDPGLHRLIRVHRPPIQTRRPDHHGQHQRGQKKPDGRERTSFAARVSGV